MRKKRANELKRAELSYTRRKSPWWLFSRLVVRGNGAGWPMSSAARRLPKSVAQALLLAAPRLIGALFVSGPTNRGRDDRVEKREHLSLFVPAIRPNAFGAAVLWLKPDIFTARLLPMSPEPMKLTGELVRWKSAMKALAHRVRKQLQSSAPTAATYTFASFAALMACPTCRCPCSTI